MFGIFSGGGRRDPTKEKAPPPFATPISFPSVHEAAGDEVLSDATSGLVSLQDRIVAVRRPKDIDVHLLQSVNLGPAVLLPASSLVHGYVPAAGSKLHNGRAFPTDEDFEARSKELTLPNSMAYAILAGKLRGDKNAPRLMQLRRFWEGLDSMANYWDTSLDEYLAPGEGYDSEHSSLISPKSTPPPSGPSRPPSSSFADQERPQSVASPVTETPDEIPKTYRGYRMSNGASMPEQHRVDTIRAFLEPITWPFGFTIQPPRRRSLLAIGNLRVPVRLSHSVWRIPKERERAQGRWVEGPIIGVSCRNETGFVPNSVASKVDIAHELAALLLLAQERAREGQTEVQPGDGKWWTSVPRWGGGTGGEAGEGRADEDRSPGDQDLKERSNGVESSAPPPTEKKRSVGKRPSLHEVWNTLKVGVGYWDPKADYRHIGQDEGTEWDQVYLVSSLNHHISLLKLEVHAAYVAALVRGTPPQHQVRGGDWERPRISRSRWFDLFNPEDRLEAMDMLWKLTSYLARDVAGGPVS